MCHDVDKVYLPMESLGKCHVCKERPGDKLCSACGERSYCSAECQKVDWKQHKAECGQTDRISLEQFYPFLSWMYASSHYMMPIKPPHPAFTSTIVNNANPDVPAIEFPDGWCARLLMLDDTRPMDPITQPDPTTWFPLAQSAKVASKLFRRIVYSGYLLPILTSVATAILTEMYTTTSGVDAPDDRRIRLRYRSMPISDFGIAAGSVRVTSQDRLAFMKKSDGRITRGQDPDDHYWLYFTTAKGEEVILECGMFPFNMCEVVDTDPYVPLSMPTYPQSDVRIGFAPSFLIERVIRKNTPTLHTERKRLSMLRNPGLQNAVKAFAQAYRDQGDSGIPLSDANTKPFYDYMEAISGRSLNSVEKSVYRRLTPVHCFSMHYILCHQEWRNFPKEPQLGIEGDPGELDYFDDAEAWNKQHKKWKKIQKDAKKDSG
ncbi:hypothetical protein QCA50_005094 [Cerrena zonata]|uniref:MYND-type domain-containing protein n=1 Tax=Cerrena zonata TaxID=2478898 RepID=A0AAW0GIR7_9APHY